MESNLIFCFLIVSGIVVIQSNVAVCKVEIKRPDSKQDAKGEKSTIREIQHSKAYFGGKPKRKDSLRPKMTSSDFEDKPYQKEIKRKGFNTLPVGKGKTSEIEKPGAYGMKPRGKFAKTKKDMKIGITKLKSERVQAKVGETKKMGDYSMKSKENKVNVRKSRITKLKPSIPQDKKISSTSTLKELHTAKLQLNTFQGITKRLKNENKMLKQMMSSQASRKPQAASADETGHLRAMLKQSKAANKRLKKLKKRQKQIWFGLQQMCKALDGGLQTNINQTESSEKENNVTKTDKIIKDGFSIQPVSIFNRILEGGQAEVQLEFRASTSHPVVDWITELPHGGYYQTGGWVDYREQNMTFLARHVVPNPSIVRKLHIRVYSDQDYFEAYLDINETNHQAIKPVEIGFEEFNSTIVAQDNKPLNESFLANGNLTQVNFFKAVFGGIYISENRHKLFEIRTPSTWYTRYMNLTVSKTSDSREQLSVEIDAETARDGGMLSLVARMFPEKMIPEYPDRMYRMEFGRTFKVLSSRTGTVVPPNSVALQMLPNITLLASPTQSISCLAMGDPRPAVTLVRESKIGLEELQPHQSRMTDEFLVTKTFTIGARDTEVEGKYTCSASNAYATVTSSTEVILYEPPIIDTAASGLTINSSNKIEISCQASGKPAPQLQLRLYFPGGPDIASSSRYKVLRSNPDGKTSLLSVTIAPVDTDIFKLYCYATNSDFSVQPARLLIDVFPEPPTGYNMKLYSEFWNY